MIIRVGLGDALARNVALGELVFQGFYGVIGVGGYGLVYHHLQDQVSATFEVQAQVDVVQHRLLQSVAAKPRWAAADTRCSERGPAG